ncbi:hypothetical protein TcasGA2_TC015454 [Tribolium castaneum]|uniref:AAA-ATPase-like domain-containing protein n=1 Tax=Tribolium castaneum TaxID=7070 RepID=D2A512_TRICA|nr:PREDICTED: uncharacterized protein LOC103313337 [Tribolium castaneum]XP_008194572.2 PREDICTED: uncharacterized protein LOC103313337 [Tribolium castaneum]EFA05297.1 hypothetical protein TcasGA2_TC015454 [Tribolium castaneum]|eukprot:XP_008194571.2 PREDICTED: uncharacterized protein LOC103313337 [Tribolium castaneum]
MFACAILIAPAARSALISNSKVYLWPLSTALSQNPSLVQSPVVQQHKQATLLPAVRSFQTTPVSRDIDSADKFIGAGAATVGVAGSGSLFIMEDNPANCLSSTLSPDFEKVLKSDTFVDKSGLMLAVFETDVQPMVLCTAPRRFGKTVNLSMMQRFLELEVDENGEEKTTVLEEKDNYKLFSSARFNLKVMENKKFVETHFGQYPIIKITFLCCVNVKSQSDAVNVCRSAISRAFRQYSYLYKSKLSPLEDDEKEVCEKWCDEFTYTGIPDDKVIEGLGCLAVYLNKFHKRMVFLLVDEYDSIISNALYNVQNADPKAELKELEEAASLPIQVIGYALKGFPEIFKGAFITGILDVGGVATSTLLGNVLRRQFGTNNLCQDFYGFTEDEVCTLFNRFAVKEELREKAKAKYNGYFNGSKQCLYNPQSIVQFLGNLSLGEGALKNYWQESGYIHNMYKLFEEGSVRTLLYELLQGVKEDFQFKLRPLDLRDLKSLHNILVNQNLTCREEIVVRFLVSLGYLTYSFHDRKLQIPNAELIDEIMELLRDYFFERFGINSELAKACSASFSELTILCDEGDSLAMFKEELANFQNSITCLLQRSTLIDPLNEATLQSIITLTCSQAGFLFGNEIIIPNHRTKVDIVLFNDKSGIIMELKCDPNTVQDAFKEIFQKRYYNVFTNKKYFDERKKSPSLSFVMAMHVDSDNKGSVMCLRREDVIHVLDDLQVDARKSSLEDRIEIAVNSMGERFINSCCEKAILVS